MSMAVVMHASDQSCSRYLTNIRLVDRLGLPRYTYGLGRWNGFGDKLLSVRAACQSLTQYSHILHIDAYDVIVIGDEKEIMRRYISTGYPILFMAEINCWPDASVASRYPDLPGPWRYLNSGCYIGERLALLDMLNSINIEPHLDDQKLATEYYLEHQQDVGLDTECVLFQSLLGGLHVLELKKGSIFNKIKGTNPVIAHHNGGGDINSGSAAILWKI